MSAVSVEMFLLFSRVLTFFTLLVEGVFIVVFVRILSPPNSINTGKVHGYAVPAALFTLLFLLLFSGEWLCGLLLPLDEGYHRLIYRVVVWDFVATVYALLEGIIFILACRLYRMLKQRAFNEPAITGYSIGRLSIAAIVGLTFLFITGFSYFECHAVHTALVFRLDSEGILNMAFFYRLAAGWCWTIFEAALAAVLIKIYLLMKQGKENFHAGR